MLSPGQEGHPREEVRVPEGDFPVAKGLAQEGLPGVVLQDEVGEQVVVGDGDPHLRGKGFPRLEGEQVVRREQRLPPEDDGPEPEQGEQEEHEQGDAVKDQRPSVRSDLPTAAHGVLPLRRPFGGPAG